MSLRDLVVATAVGALLVSACGQAIETDIAALSRLQHQVDSAIIDGDTDRYLTMITDDAVLMPPNGPAVRGKEAIGLWNRAMSAQVRITAYSSRDDEVVVDDDWAFRRAAMDWTLMPVAGGAAIRDSGKYIIIYRRQQDGSWKVARDIWSSNTTPR